MERRKIENDLLNSGFTDMQSESLSYLFTEMAAKQDVRELRSEMRGEFRAVRSEMRGEFRAVRAEMQGEFRAVRAEMQGEFRVVRSEMQEMKAELREAIAESGKQTMEAIATFQNKLFAHVLVLIAVLTTIVTLIELLVR